MVYQRYYNCDFVKYALLSLAEHMAVINGCDLGYFPIAFDE